MGLILVPLLIFWVVVGFTSLHMGFNLTQQMSNISALVFVLLSLLLVGFYLKQGFSRFNSSTEVGVFDIPMFFLSKTPMMLCSLIGVLFYGFSDSFLINIFWHAGLIIVMFTGAFGAIFATFFSECYIEKKKIKKVF